MIYSDTPLDEWLKKTGIDLDHLKMDIRECHKCKEKDFVYRPCYINDMYAVVMECKKCGTDGPALLTPRTEKAKEFWKTII